MMETKEQKPWYHGVKWVSSDQNGPPGICLQAQVFDHAGQSVACIDPTTDPKTASHYAWLMASAPGIATQRDELLSVQKQLVAALEVQEGDLVMLCRAVTANDPKPEILYRTNDMLACTRAALLAAKASS
jgi:hypothetical protein